MGRFGDSEKDLVGALLFLLNNDAAGFITGICLPSMAASPPIRACKNTRKSSRFSYESRSFFVFFRTLFYSLLFLLDFFHIAPEGRAADAQLTAAAARFPPWAATAAGRHRG